jgi:hypothetical protein
MKLSEFTDLLNSHREEPFLLVLPGSELVQRCFHITEAAFVSKTFIDCGGRLHTAHTCQLQVWIADDTEHRLLSGKMAGILEIARRKGVLPADQDPDIEVEYESTLISQYPVESWAIVDGTVLLQLSAKHTDCLAKDICLPVLPMVSDQSNACCAGSGCC